MTREQRTRSYAARKGHAVRRILKLWEEAAPEYLGKQWYRDALRVAKSIHSNPLCGAGVIAALSPQCAWKTNIAWAEKLCGSAMKNRGYAPPVSTFRNRKKAWEIANLKNPTEDTVLSVLGGQKVKNFFKNIIGHRHSVTVDGWSAFAAEGRVHNPTTIRGLRYDMIAEAYRKAAQQLNTDPRTVQSVVWVKVRGSAQ